MINSSSVYPLLSLIDINSSSSSNNDVINSSSVYPLLSLIDINSSSSNNYCIKYQSIIFSLLYFLSFTIIIINTAKILFVFVLPTRFKFLFPIFVLQLIVVV